MLAPLRLGMDKLHRARGDSDTTLFFELLYLGEFILKLTTVGLVAAIDDDRDRHRYRLMHKLVRADGVGEWSQALEDLLGGPASQFLVAEAKEDRRIITERVAAGSWQHRVVSELIEAAQFFDVAPEIGREKIALQSWFALFPQLRNKTRGHGAPRLTSCAAAVRPLESSITTIINENPVFHREWAYLRQNLSGKYHVVSFGGAAEKYRYLTRTNRQSEQEDHALPEGTYIFFDKPRRVSLLTSDADLSDFFMPNGAFAGTRYELHSPITDSKRVADANEFLAPATDRPASETAAADSLQPLAKVWANLPPRPDGYVFRPDLEGPLQALLTDDRHPIVTLTGRGGIGKTSLALNVLHQLAKTTRYGAMFWFSARDIDLTQAGPKLAKPDVLTEADIANQFSEMLAPAERTTKTFKASTYMATNMAHSSIADPLLFIFDNFETVRNPIDVFNWIDTNIRSPNKALITTRFRDFKADYPLEVQGMDREEVNRLIDNTSTHLGSAPLFTEVVRDAIFDQSDGHPYIVKIIVGEISDTGISRKPERIIASKDDILDALFERTYNNISSGAKRIFLTLCGWRSYIPRIALEAIIFRNQSDTIDTGASIDELDKMSLIQTKRDLEGQDFLSVPLAASIFGQKKLATSPLRTPIELDIRFLQELGPTSASSIGQGVNPRIHRLVQNLAAKISDGKMEFSSAKALPEFIASRLPETWILLADLSREVDVSGNREIEGEYLRRYIESGASGSKVNAAWDRLARLYRASGDVLAACDAYTRAFSTGSPPYYDLSNVANWLNNQMDVLGVLDVADRKAVLMPFAALMERRLAEASADDLSRLAWLHLHAGNTQRSDQVARLGLIKEPANIHCQRLIDRLRDQY